MNYGFTPTRTGDIIFFLSGETTTNCSQLLSRAPPQLTPGFLSAHYGSIQLSRHNLRSGILFSEERERKATRDSAVSQTLVRREKSFFFLAFPDRRLSRCYTFALLRKKRTPDRRLITTPQ